MENSTPPKSMVYKRYVADPCAKIHKLRMCSNSQCFCSMAQELQCACAAIHKLKTFVHCLIVRIGTPLICPQFRHDCLQIRHKTTIHKAFTKMTRKVCITAQSVHNYDRISTVHTPYASARPFSLPENGLCPNPLPSKHLQLLFCFWHTLWHIVRILSRLPTIGDTALAPFKMGTTARPDGTDNRHHTLLIALLKLGRFDSCRNLGGLIR